MKPAFDPNSFVLDPASSRRQFLSAGSAAVLAALAFPWGVTAQQRKFAVKLRMLDELRPAMFVQQLNTAFEVTDAPTGRVGLKLIEVSPDRPSPHKRADAPDAGHEKFSLLFMGPKEPLLASRIYRFEQAKMGYFDLFIVPIVTEENDRQHYEAIFNRPVRPR